MAGNYIRIQSLLLCKLAPPEMDAEESLVLPKDILEEILVRLPMKLLLRFRRVSKSWLSLIDSKEFMKSHLQYSTKNTYSAHHRVLICSLSNSKPMQWSVRALPNLSPLCHPISKDPITVDPYYDSCCCNGVLCFYQRRSGFQLLNPTTRVGTLLPKDPEIDNRAFLKLKMGFGWDESCCAYKVFAGWRRMKRDPPCTLQYKSRVYSSKTKSWKTVEDPFLSTRNRGQVGKFVGGKLHWLNREKKSVTISSFDMKTEEFGTIELPCQTEFYLSSLGVVGDCLCFSAKYDQESAAFHVWVMKESWEKLPTFHLHDPRFSAQVIGEAANGEILIKHARSLYFYCPRNGEILHRMVIGCKYRAHLYVESLVSPLS